MISFNSIEKFTAAEVKHLWEKGQIRGLILTSLVIQVLLTFLAPKRKFKSSSCLMLWTWILYLSADVVAVYIIGLISSERNHSAQKELQAFWAPFLLLHLGGPDTITALAMEDNELWRRHALQLATQVLVTIYVFARSIRHNSLWIPTILMFVDGFIKYFERTCALFYASSDNFRDSLRSTPEPGPNYARLMEEHFSAKCAHIPSEFDVDYGRSENIDQNLQGDEAPDKISEYESSSGTNTDASEAKDLKHQVKTVMEAHSFYEMFKPLLADGFLSLKDREWSRNFFFKKTLEEALEIMEIELNLIYDIFYTKSFLLQKKRAYARFLCFLLVVASLLLFFLRWDFKHHVPDAIITFTLLFGAIALDICAGIMFVLSDWWIIIAHSGKINKKYECLMLRILQWSKFARQSKSQRWSGTISKYNLLKRCFRKPPSLLNFQYIVGIKHIRDFLYRFVYVKAYKAEDKLIKFVMLELWQKAKLASDIKVAKEVFSARGNLVLQDDYFLASECLSPWTVDIDYDESLLIWHLATDICYWSNWTTASSNDNHSSETRTGSSNNDHSSETRTASSNNDHSSETRTASSNNDHSSETRTASSKNDHSSGMRTASSNNDHSSETRTASSNNDHRSETRTASSNNDHSSETRTGSSNKPSEGSRELDYKAISKSLSDYMLNLIMWQQKLLSSVVGMSDTRFEDTCAEARKFMKKELSISWNAYFWWKVKKCILCKKFCCRTTSSQEGESPYKDQQSDFFKQFSQQVLNVKADVEPSVAKGDKSKSVLFDACRLAKQLQLFGEKEQWKIMSKVWVELLCYAAVRCSPRSHIAQLSKGGELITFVWLYMAHLGLGERFLQNQGFGRTKLIIHK